MPRTKLKKAASKRTRHSTIDETRANAIAEMERELERMLRDINFQQEQKWNRIRNNLKNIKSKLPAQVLAMTWGELEELSDQGCKNYDDVQTHFNKTSGALANITNTVNNVSHMSAKAASRTDDGYITGDSLRSDTSKSSRQLGPYQSAKAKPRRRSRSVNSALQQYTQTAPSSQQIMNRNVSRESRSKFRTPNSVRIQTMSADRCMGPVTPKVPMGGQSIAMLRYARQGETVISLDGSPVVASNMIGNRANLNIPVADGIISIQPMNGVVDSNLVSQIDMETLEQLRQLQDNLDIIMQAAFNHA